jgi:hypothetical protein
MSVIISELIALAMGGDLTAILAIYDRLENRTHFAGPNGYLLALGWFRDVLLPNGPSIVRLRASLPTERLFKRSFDIELRSSRSGSICGRARVISLNVSAVSSSEPAALVGHEMPLRRR